MAMEEQERLQEDIIWQPTVCSLCAGLIIKGNGVISEKPHFVMEIGRIYIMAAQWLYTLYSAALPGEALCCASKLQVILFSSNPSTYLLLIEIAVQYSLFPLQSFICLIAKNKLKIGKIHFSQWMICNISCSSWKTKYVCHEASHVYQLYHVVYEPEDLLYHILSYLYPRWLVLGQGGQPASINM